MAKKKDRLCVSCGEPCYGTRCRECFDKPAKLGKINRLISRRNRQ